MRRARRLTTDVCAVKETPVWMPGAGFKRRALEVGRYVRAWKETGYGIVKAALVGYCTGWS